MSNVEVFAIASFRSRQATLKFQEHLRKVGVPCGVVNTPREVAVGCGLSVRFDLSNILEVKQVYEEHMPPYLIGFYTVERIGSRQKLYPLVM